MSMIFNVRKIAWSFGLLASAVCSGLPAWATVPTNNPPKSDTFSMALNPAVWTGADLNVTPAGGEAVAGNKLTVMASGSSFGEQVEEGRFTYQTGITGSFSTQVTVDAVPTTNALGSAGIEARQSGSSGAAAFASIDGTRDKGAEFKWRTDPTQPIHTTTTGSLKAPFVLRLDRVGSLFTGRFSTDGGNTWTTVGSATVALTDPIDVGLITRSHQSGVLASAVYANFTATAIPVGGIAGTVTDQNMKPVAGQTIRVTGANGNVSTTTDTNGKYEVFVVPGDYTINGASELVDVAAKSAAGLTAGAELNGDLSVTTLPDLGLSTASGNATWKLLPNADATSAAPADPAFNDSAWQAVTVPKNLASNPIAEGTTFWYRAHFQIPAGIPMRYAVLYGYTVADSDSTWLNGHYIGSNSGATSGRRYYIPPEDIKFGGDNVLAIRVKRNSGAAGINTTEPHIHLGSSLLGGANGIITKQDTTPFSGVTVTLNPGGSTTTTGSDGSFNFIDVPAGAYTISLPPVLLDGGASSRSVTVTGGTFEPGTDNLAVTVPTQFFESDAPDPHDDSFGGPGLDPKWTAVDINTTKAGSQTVGGGILTLTADGGDIWGNGDNGRYIYQSYTGNFAATLYVLNTAQTDQWAKTGIMVRATLDTDSSNAFPDSTRDHGPGLQRRDNKGNGSNDDGHKSGSAPQWLKIRRVGSWVAAWSSQDGGVTQQFLGVNNIPGLSASQVLLGIMATSHDNGVLGNSSVAAFKVVPLDSSGAPTTSTGLLSLSNTTAQPGTLATLNLALDRSLGNVKGGTVVLDYTGSTPAGAPTLQLLTPADVVGVGALGTTQVSADFSTAGTIKLTLNPATPLMGPGNVVSIPFVVPPTTSPGTVYHIRIASANLTDSSGNPINATTQSGQIDVLAMSLGQAAFTINSMKATKGTTVSVPILINNQVANALGATVYLNVSPALSVTSEADVMPGPTVPLHLGEFLVNAQLPGQIRIGAVTPQGLTGPGVFATVPFQIPAGAHRGDVYTLTVSGTLTAPGGVDVPFSGSTATLTVRDVSPGLLVAGETKVSVGDATRALQILVGNLRATPTDIEAGALLNGKTITIGDVILILQAALGIGQLPQ